MLYGEDLYGRVLYGNDSGSPSINVSPDPYGQYYTDLEKYVPEFVSDLVEMDAIYRAEGYECGLARHRLDDLWNQTFVSTATWALSRYEQDYGISASSDQTLEQRRRFILAKRLGGKTCTKAVIKQLAEQLTGVETKVIEDNPNFTFTLFFIGQYGVPRNVRVLRSQIADIKPAHLLCKFEYRYVTWQEIKDRKWDDIRKYTWDGLRVNGIIKRVTWQGIKTSHIAWRRTLAMSWDNVKNDLEEAKT